MVANVSAFNFPCPNGNSPNCTSSIDEHMQTPEACQAHCQASNGCDFFVWEAVSAASCGGCTVSTCRLKARDADSNHLYTEWLDCGWNHVHGGPRLCASRALLRSRDVSQLASSRFKRLSSEIGFFPQ